VARAAVATGVFLGGATAVVNVSRTSPVPHTPPPHSLLHAPPRSPVCPLPCSLVCPLPCSPVCPLPCSPVCPLPCSPVCPPSRSRVCPLPCNPVCPLPCNPVCPLPCSGVCPLPCSLVCPLPCSPVCPLHAAGCAPSHATPCCPPCSGVYPFLPLLPCPDTHQHPPPQTPPYPLHPSVQTVTDLWIEFSKGRGGPPLAKLIAEQGNAWRDPILITRSAYHDRKVVWEAIVEFAMHKRVSNDCSAGSFQASTSQVGTGNGSPMTLFRFRRWPRGACRKQEKSTKPPQDYRLQVVRIYEEGLLQQTWILRRHMQTCALQGM